MVNCAYFEDDAKSESQMSDLIEEQGGRAMKTIGILCLQGAVQEHAAMLEELGCEIKEVRLPADLEGLDGLVLPGGESTAMAIVGERWGIFPALRKAIDSGLPVWGTCAGMILLSGAAVATKLGGQALVGGLDALVCRNFFGAQIASFEIPVDTRALGQEDQETPYPGVFIRAPGILEVGENVEVLASVRAAPCAAARPHVQDLVKMGEKRKSADGSPGRATKRRRASASPSPPDQQQETSESGAAIEEPVAGGEEEDGKMEVIVGCRQGNILATAFHPELTQDTRWHKFFLGMVNSIKA